MQIIGSARASFVSCRLVVDIESHGHQERDISGIHVSTSGRERRGPPTFACPVDIRILSRRVPSTLIGWVRPNSPRVQKEAYPLTQADPPQRMVWKGGGRGGWLLFDFFFGGKGEEVAENGLASVCFFTSCEWLGFRLRISVPFLLSVSARRVVIRFVPHDSHMAQPAVWCMSPFMIKH